MAVFPLFRCLIIGRRCTGGWRDYCRWNAPDFPAACVVMLHYGRLVGHAWRGPEHLAPLTPSLPRLRPSIDQMSLSCCRRRRVATFRVDIHSFLLLSATHIDCTAAAAATAAAAEPCCVHGDEWLQRPTVSNFSSSSLLTLTLPTHHRCTYTHWDFIQQWRTQDILVEVSTFTCLLMSGGAQPLIAFWSDFRKNISQYKNTTNFYSPKNNSRKIGITLNALV